MCRVCSISLFIYFNIYSVSNATNLSHNKWIGILFLSSVTQCHIIFSDLLTETIVYQLVKMGMLDVFPDTFIWKLPYYSLFVHIKSYQFL